MRGGDVVEISRHLLLQGRELVLAFVVFFFFVFAGEGGVGAAVAGAVAAFVGASVSIIFISLIIPPHHLNTPRSGKDRKILTAQDYHSSKTPSYKHHKHTASPAYAS